MPIINRIVENGRSKYIFEFSVPSLISIGGALGLLLVWSFILGIILGRGDSNPTELGAPMANILPDVSSGNNLITPTIVESNGGIIRPEELRFRENLKDPQSPPPITATTTVAPLSLQSTQNNQATQQSTPATALNTVTAKPSQNTPAQNAKTTSGPSSAQANKQTAGQAAGTTNKPATGQTAKQAVATPAVATATKSTATPSPKTSAVDQALSGMEKQTQPANNVAAKPSAAPSPTQPATTTTKPSASTRYKYVYQVAASRDATQAESMLRRLASVGLEGRVEKQNPDGWSRIVVSFTGTPDDTQQLRDTVAKVGIDRIIMREKKEISTP